MDMDHPDAPHRTAGRGREPVDEELWTGAGQRLALQDREPALNLVQPLLSHQPLSAPGGENVKKAYFISWHFFPFDGWRHGRSTPKGDLCAKGENDPLQTQAAHHRCDAKCSFGW
jgi:hypothetical protein